MIRLEKNGKLGLDNVISAVYYCWKEGQVLFPPAWNYGDKTKMNVSDIPKGKLIHYKSSGNSIKLKDFKKYDYEFFLDNDKFSDFDIMDLFSDNERSLVGHIPSDIEKFTSYSVPTIYTNSREDINTDGYFKAKRLSGGRTVYQFEAPEGCYKVELYSQDITLSSGNTKNNRLLDTSFNGKSSEVFKYEPIMSIYLGPTKNNKLNYNSMYYNSDIDIERETITKTAREYRELIEEITCAKIITLISTSDSDEIYSINTPQSSFYESKNPLRNLKEVVLRNDEWYGSRDCITQFGIKKGSLYDLVSGNLLGNKLIKTTPILKEKTELLNNKYSVNHVYMKNDVVTVGENEFISVADNNLGNYPAISTYWILKSEFDNTFSKTVDIIVDPKDSTIVSKAFLVYDAGKSVSFTIKPGYGYEFKESANTLENTLYIDDKTLLNPRYFTYFRTVNIDGEITRTITINDWGELLRTSKLIVRANAKFKEFSFRLQYNGLYYDYFVGNKPEKIAVGSVKVNGNTTPIKSKNDKILQDIKLTDTDTVLDLDSFDTDFIKLAGVKASYTFADYSTKDDLLVKGSDEFNFVDPTASSAVVYTIVLEDRLCDCRIFYNTEVWEFENPCPDLIYGEDIVFRYYALDSSNRSIKQLKVVMSNEDNDRTLVLSGDRGTKSVENGIQTYTIPKNILWTSEVLRKFRKDVTVEVLIEHE